ncbi:hypothetical protein Q5424_14800 [Conexibacter sp. JD483]|uniref:hypothetical protein n=1 Tax=unclassified Conexibacter TaxID=2627773 RepID=UPI0027231A2E|nr:MULTISPECIES: hypothetical protein [unclassified Conexibacter]MDO8188014.1 hypothetical protein [Conexibacter sp. CPCC 205706]MDO8200897.1 hypothetical protein [Conexibacter sp. CPCC 205762]MDR9370370.1 hypothetical protein [Conexibacter sp. JD483]
MTDLLRHPLATPAWEQAPAARVRIGSRALWATPAAGEESAPARRLIHARSLHADTPMTLRRLLVDTAAGYHKCASGAELDRPTRVVVRVPDGDGWRVLADEAIDGASTAGVAIDLGDTRTTAAAVELRSAAVDGWWPSWNLAQSSLRLEGELPAPWVAPRQGWLSVEGLQLDGLPDGVSAEHRNGEVRYRTPYLEIGFRLRVPALAHLSLDDDGAGRTGRDLLQQPRSMDIVRSGLYPSGVYPVLRDGMAGYLAQSPRLTTHAGANPVGFLAFDFDGSTEVRGNVVRYVVDVAGGQRYELTWTVLRDRVELTATRLAAQPLRAWTSSAWHVALDNRVTPSAVLGAVTQAGEAGLVEGPLLWHFPRHGTLRVSADGPALFRSDSVRPLDTNTLELKLGERPLPEGDYLLEAGTHTASVTFAVGAPDVAPTRPEAPPAVRRMLARHALTALPFRPDTATYSNNGASMHVTSALNDLSAISLRIGAVVDGLTPRDMLRLSLERWLSDAPAYGSGRTSHGDHMLEDEYVHLGADTLLGLARFLLDAEPAWYAAQRERIVLALSRMRARDADDDGLVESTLRRGISGEHQWSTAWSDVLSFGWKDAWANAVLYEALRTLDLALARLDPGLAATEDLGAWADRLRGAYLPAFLNPATGWIAGWRGADQRLHDYAFFVVNGAAVSTDLVPEAEGAAIMRALWGELRAVGYDDLRNGLPFNLRRVPEEDIGGVVFGLPLGGYLQGGACHHRVAPVIAALRRVGMAAEADELLEALASTVADDSAFGGVGSGRDWRMWDGTPSGYEGQLAEGFSLIASAIDRWGALA